MYNYELEKHPKKKGTCPQCSTNHVFRYYQNAKTGERAKDEKGDFIFGRCERINNCNYHLYPKTEINDKKEMQINEPVKQSRDYTDFSLLFATLRRDNSKNVFLVYLKKYVAENVLNQILQKYHVGTTKENQPIFWCVDMQNRVTSGKIIKYNNEFKRLHGAGNLFNASKLIKPDGNFSYCFFGEHLLALPENENKTVAIVESEKTCLVADIWLKELDYVWLACGGSNGLTNEKMSILRDKKVILFTDCDKAGRDAFNKKCNEYKEYGYDIFVHDFGEKFNNGEDIADFWQDEMLKSSKEPEPTPEVSEMFIPDIPF